LVPANER